jgi:hypothetical protein
MKNSWSGRSDTQLASVLSVGVCNHSKDACKLTNNKQQQKNPCISQQVQEIIFVLGTHLLHFCKLFALILNVTVET